MNSDAEIKAGVEEIWSAYDTDNSGKLDKKQAFEFLKSANKGITGEESTKHQIETDFIKMDLDKSGDIDKEEAVKYLKGVKIGMQLKAMMSGVSDKKVEVSKPPNADGIPEVRNELQTPAKPQEEAKPANAPTYAGVSTDSLSAEQVQHHFETEFDPYINELKYGGHLTPGQKTVEDHRGIEVTVDGSLYNGQLTGYGQYTDGSGN